MVDICCNCMLLAQLVEPELVPGDVRASLQSEYNTSYNTKAESTGINQAVVHIAADIAKRVRTTEQMKTSVLSKMLNAITKTIPYPLVMSASYLLGNGDSWCPMRVTPHDFAQFQRMHLEQPGPYEDTAVATEFAAPDAGEAATQPRRIMVMDAVLQYKDRHPALSEWSPFELAMGFTCEKASKPTEKTKVSNLFQLQGELGSRCHLVHKPRRCRGGKVAMAIPQPRREHPRRPAPDALASVREDYAAWALGNFYSDRCATRLCTSISGQVCIMFWVVYHAAVATSRRLLTELTECHQSEPTLWSRFLTWERLQPRGQKDEFAFRCLRNVELRLEARSLMRAEGSRKRLLQRQILNVPKDSGDYNEGPSNYVVSFVSKSMSISVNIGRMRCRS